jgi:5-methylcytosine-specific restriction enzyme A
LSKLYFHHVGRLGLSDFAKTVFSRRSVDLISEVRAVDTRDRLTRSLTRLFPSGDFNCWGVPSGATTVIQNLSPGDHVLLVESIGPDGKVPALCRVKHFERSLLPELSYALWGDAKYPLIFFFDTERIKLSWEDLVGHLGYASNFDPRGKFYSVADTRLERFAGLTGLLQLIRAQHGLNRVE